MAALKLIAKPMVAGLALLAFAMPARADGHFGLSLDFTKGGHGQPVAVATHVVVAPRRVWVAPVYKTVIERVWVPTETVAYRDVPVIDRHGRVVSYRREAYTVQSGHWVERPRQVLVCEGHWVIERHAGVRAHVGIR